jgi:hypothetical protein
MNIANIYVVGASRIRRMARVGLPALALIFAFSQEPAPAATQTLEVVGSGDSHTVEFAVCPREAPPADSFASASSCPDKVAKSAPAVLAGDTTLLVRLNVKEDPQLTARFVPDGDAARKLLCGDKPRIFLDGRAPEKGCAFHSRAVGGTNSIALRLGFRLPAGVPVASIGGKLLLGLGGKDEDKPIPIEGAPHEFKGVTVTPTTIVLDSDDPSGEVTLTGPDVVDLLRSLALGKTGAILRDDAGDTAVAVAEFPNVHQVETSSNPDSVQGEVTLNGDPSPGKYTGKLPLTHAAAEGPSIEIELRSHRSLCLMVLFVLLGIVVVGLIGRLIALATRRSIMLEALDQSVDAYECVEKSGKTRAWRLDDLLGVREGAGRHAALHAVGEVGQEEDQAEGKHVIGFAPDDYKGLRLQGLPALRESIAEARSSKDLDEDADRTLDMIARIQRWLRVEPVARLLQAVSEEDRPDALSGPDKPPGATGAKKEEGPLEWEKSQTWLGTLALLKMARREPADAAKADDLVARLLDQARWHHLYAWAWKRAESGKELAGELIALDKAIGEEKTAIGLRTQEARDVLAARLCALVEDHLPDLESPRMPFPGDPPDCPTRLGITGVDWQASPNLFTGWATLDKPSYGQLARRLATSSKTVYRRSGFGRALVREARALRPGVDLAWTTLILGLTSLSYGLTNYSHTWGSDEDLAKAFLAGALGTAVVKWGALPIFRSGRIRASKAA